MHGILARPVLRAFQSARPWKQPLRRYATDPKLSSSSSSSSSSRSTIVLVSAVGITAGASYYFFARNGPTAAQKAEAKTQEPAAVKKALTGGEQGFVSLRLEDVQPVNHNTKIFRFRLPEDEMVSGLQVASAILTRFQAPGAEKPVIRPYTPISDEDAKGYMSLLVKKYEGGPMSTHIHDLAPGQSLDIKGPIPKYPWSENKHEHIGLVAGGTAITPMYQLCRAIFSNPSDKTKVTLVFGNIAEEDILLKQELADLENTYPQRFRAFYLLDNPPKDWAGEKGYITKDLLKTVLPEPKAENIKVFVCGPPGMMNAISGGKKSPTNQGDLSGFLQELGYSKDQVHKF